MTAPQFAPPDGQFGWWPTDRWPPPSSRSARAASLGVTWERRLGGRQTIEVLIPTGDPLDPLTQEVPFAWDYTRELLKVHTVAAVFDRRWGGWKWRVAVNDDGTLWVSGPARWRENLQGILYGEWNPKASHCRVCGGTRSRCRRCHGTGCEPVKVETAP